MDGVVHRGSPEVSGLLHEWACAFHARPGCSGASVTRRVGRVGRVGLVGPVKGVGEGERRATRRTYRVRIFFVFFVECFSEGERAKDRRARDVCSTTRSFERSTPWATRRLTLPSACAPPRRSCLTGIKPPLTTRLCHLAYTTSLCTGNSAGRAGSSYRDGKSAYVCVRRDVDKPDRPFNSASYGSREVGFSQSQDRSRDDRSRDDWSNRSGDRSRDNRSRDRCRDNRSRDRSRDICSRERDRSRDRRGDPDLRGGGDLRAGIRRRSQSPRGGGGWDRNRNNRTPSPAGGLSTTPHHRPPTPTSPFIMGQLSDEVATQLQMLQDRPTTFKNSVCKFFIEGRCVRGDACCYAHDKKHVINLREHKGQDNRFPVELRSEVHLILSFRDGNALWVDRFADAYELQLDGVRVWFARHATLLHDVGSSLLR